MTDRYVVFLQIFARSLPQIVALLGDEWPRIRRKLLALAVDAVTDRVLADTIVRTLGAGPTADLVRSLMREASPVDSRTTYRSQRQPPRFGDAALARAASLAEHGAAAARVIDELRSLTPSEAGERREITVTVHGAAGEPIASWARGECFKLRWFVGAPTAGNLAVGDVGIEDIPNGGLQTRWVVTSSSVEFVPDLGGCKVEQLGRTWRAEFDLLIPERGPSESRELSAVAPAGTGTLLLSIYTVLPGGACELYREVAVSLAAGAEVIEDQISKSPQYTHLKTTHEWTTPAEHIQVSFVNGLVQVSTKRFLLQAYDFAEPSAASTTTLSAPIKNALAALEDFREAYDAYLDDLDSGDMASRLAGVTWPPYQSGGPWCLSNDADSAHAAAFAQVEKDDEVWRALASNGYTLFNACFPQGTQLRAVIENMHPGSRIDFHWTAQSDPGYVSHVPWALMYLEPVTLTGPVDPEKFFGLRFRLASRSWRASNGSVVLGGLDTARAMHLLYWSREAGDDVGVEAAWQEHEFDSSRTGVPSAFLPDAKISDPKMQIKLALEAPGPSPVALIYFYCHCIVGDGSQPILRFGGSSKVQDVIRHVDISQSAIPDAPLVFANACSTAQADPHMTSQLEQAFFARGVRAFIGTETKVPVRLASKFAWLYFQFLYRLADTDRSPMSAGEALTQARMFLWTQYRNIGGLFYSISNQYDLYLASQQEVISLRKKDAS